MHTAPLHAVIPAAGKGARLGLNVPKILVSVASGVTIWDVLAEKLALVADRLVVVMSPNCAPMMQKALATRPIGKPVDIALQPEPLGMGDAVFCSHKWWRSAESLLIVWGDQVHVSADTLRASITAHLAAPSPSLTIPIVRLKNPYVEYVFDSVGRLVAVRQSREGDVCSTRGWGDVGTFLLSTLGLEEAWREHLSSRPVGALTGELNFLPFMVYLSQDKHWPVRRVIVDNIDEARGINTIEDLTFFQKLYANGIHDAHSKHAKQA